MCRLAETLRKELLFFAFYIYIFFFFLFIVRTVLNNTNMYLKIKVKQPRDIYYNNYLRALKVKINFHTPIILFE